MNRRAMHKTHSLLRHLIMPAVLALAACGPTKTPLSEAPLAGATIGGEFTLNDKAGKPVRWGDFAGKWRVVYFGYTSCPDACPLDLGKLIAGFKQFEKAEPELGAKTQPLFITIDPARDTPARVGEFAAAFSPRLIGLSGNDQQIAAAAKTFGIYYARGKDRAGGYDMDHSRIAYLFDPAGKPIATLPIDKSPEAVAAELAIWVR